MNETGIAYVDRTWNPVTGCTPVSEGCTNCYAKAMATRLAGRCGYPADDPFCVALRPGRLFDPLRRHKPARIFVCSMGDLFHEDVPFEFIDKVWAVMALAPQHTFLVLTKRPRRMLIYLRTFMIATKGASIYALAEALNGPPVKIRERWPLPNVWLGVTAENQATAEERIPHLLQCPAAVRWVSVEPMLSPVQLAGSLDWVVCGGESGPKPRPMRLDWPGDLRDACAEASVPFYMKQMSGRAPIPRDLQIRQLPKEKD